MYDSIIIPKIDIIIECMIKTINISMNGLAKDIIGIVYEYLISDDLMRSSRIDKKWHRAYTINLWKYKIVLIFYYTKITDTQLSYLKGVHTINLSNCQRITDTGLSHLKGVHTIDLYGCKRITDIGLSHLKGVHTINLSNCRVTDIGLSHLKSVHTIYLEDCQEITDIGLSNFKNDNPTTIIYT